MASIGTIPRGRLFWILQIGGWLGLIPLFTGVSALFMPDFLSALYVGTIRQGIGFLLTLAMWRVYRRWPPAQFTFQKYAFKIFACCVVAAGLDFALSEVARLGLALTEPPLLVVRGSVLIRLSLYVAWSAVYFAVRQGFEARDTELRLARAEAAARESELEALRAQVNPHFLFNALNAIIGQAEVNPAAVIETTHAVADYLRYSLTQPSHQAALGLELTAVAHYLAVEQVNHGPHRLAWEIDAPPDAREARVPTALVQPLVENAIKYGIRTSPSPLRLRIAARVEGPALRVAVENTGRWYEHPAGASSYTSTGIGLANVRRRLALICGESATLTTAMLDGRVCVEARLPFVPAAASDPIKEGSLVPSSTTTAKETGGRRRETGR